VAISRKHRQSSQESDAMAMGGCDGYRLSGCGARPEGDRLVQTKLGHTLKDHGLQRASTDFVSRRLTY
jgi:hypothetical protein